MKTLFNSTVLKKRWECKKSLGVGSAKTPFSARTTVNWRKQQKCSRWVFKN